jgi:hypothetical protein
MPKQSMATVLTALACRHTHKYMILFNIFCSIVVIHTHKKQICSVGRHLRVLDLSGGALTSGGASAALGEALYTVIPMFCC